MGTNLWFFLWFLLRDDSGEDDRWPFDRGYVIGHDDRYRAPPMIYARRPWTPDSEATVLFDKLSVRAVTAPGFTYLLEVDLAKEVIEVWGQRPRRQGPDSGGGGRRRHPVRRARRVRAG